MGQLVFTAEERDRVKSTFASVKSNGQALAAIDSTLAMAEKMRSVLLSDGGAYRAQSAKDIADYEKPLRDGRPALAGSPTMAVGATWSGLASKAMTLWFLVRTIEQGLPPGEDLGDGWGAALSSSISDLPATIDSAAKVATVAVKKITNTVKDVGVAVGGAAGSIAWATVKPLLPLLLIVGLGVGVYVYAGKKGLV